MKSKLSLSWLARFFGYLDYLKTDSKVVTHQYSRILDEDRIRIADAMNEDFYRKNEHKSDEEVLLSKVKNNPELFKQFVAFMSMTDSVKKTE